MLRSFSGAVDMRDAVHVTWVRPDGHPAAEGLRIAAEGMVGALRRTGVPAAIGINAFVHDAINIVIGAHSLDASLAPTLPERTIVYNSEPLDDARHAEALAPFVARFPVWDYHPRNLPHLHALGNRRALVVAPGYLPEFVRVEHAAEKDVDVLFYGQMSPHRRAILQALERAGCRVAWLHDVYGAELDAWIGRAKLVLNIHYRPHAPMELGRLVYLLCNRCAVVTESDRPDDIDDDLSDGVAMASAATLATRAVGLLADPAACAGLAQRGFAAVRRRDFTRNVQRALAATDFG
ncbi:MAG: hypothetical protein ABI920_14060 [Casimicrobiaceae bacterium]